MYGQQLARTGERRFVRACVYVALTATVCGVVCCNATNFRPGASIAFVIFIQDVGRRRQAGATTGDHRYVGSHVVRPSLPPPPPSPNGLDYYQKTAVTKIRQQIPSLYRPTTTTTHFRQPAWIGPTNQHKRMVPQRRLPVNANQLSHAPIGPVQQQQQHYAPQQPQRPAYLPVPLPIHLQPASIILPSPPPQSYQQPTPYVSPAAPAQASYGGAYPQQQASQQQYNQAPPPAPYQPPPPPPPPQQPQYQQPQYQPPPPPPPAPYQPPQPQYQPPPPPAPYQAPPQPQYQPPPPPPPPQQPEYQPAPQQYAPPPPPPPPQQEYQQASQPEYQQAPPPPPAPLPQPEYQQAPQEYAPPPPPPAPYQAPASAPIEPLLPPPLYARQPQQQQQQQQQPAPSAEAYSAPEYAEVNTAAPAYEANQQQEQSVGGYSASEPVTVPPVVEESGSYSTLAPLASDQDLQTNAISASSQNVPKKEESSQWSQGSIPWTLEKLGLNTLNDLLVLSGLDEMFDKEGPFTVFVPVDQAFEILIQRFGGMEKASEEFNKNPDVLNSLLKHHVVPGAIQSSALQNNGAMQSLLSTPLRVKFYESEDNEWRPLKVITVNGARVVKPDIQATNGVIHIVDRVLFPVPQADIYNTLKNDPQQRYTTLVSAIDRAGLTAVLANPTAGPYTVFAPTNKAFSLISRAELNGILNDPAKLTKLLQRHVVQDLIYTSGLQGFQKAYALDFEILYIYHAKGMTKVNGANVIDQDMTTLNGVVHTIDSVLGLY